MSTLIHQLSQQFPDLKFMAQEPLKNHTPVKIGGPAEVFWQAHDQKNLIDVCKFCLNHNIPFQLIGWGANTLFSDQGLTGLVIKNSVTQLVLLPQPPQTDQRDNSQLLNATSGFPLPVLINQLLNQNIVGLEFWARIPATVGGAIYNNIHGFQGKLLSSIVSQVEVLSNSGEVLTLQPEELEFAYDYSRFHHTNETILSAQFVLNQADPSQAKELLKQIATAKRHHPPVSLGCVFQNLTPDQQQQLQINTTSTGYVIDKLLNLSGFQIGDAQISTKHAAFIENIGAATAQDYLNVIGVILTKAREQLDIELKTEIFFKGFSSSELAAAGLSGHNK